MANALGPHIKRKTIVDQGGNREKQIEGRGRKSLSLPTIQEEKEVTYVECDKSQGSTYLHYPTDHHHQPTPPPPYPITSMTEEEDMELCSGVYSTIQDVEIINIP